MMKNSFNEESEKKADGMKSNHPSPFSAPLPTPPPPLSAPTLPQVSARNHEGASSMRVRSAAVSSCARTCARGGDMWYRGKKKKKKL